GPEDRLLDTGVLAHWIENVEFQVDPIQFQVELWCRHTEASRNDAFRRLQVLVNQLDGQCVRQRAIPEIMYHGVIAQVPRARVEEAVSRINDATYTELLRCGDVMFFRPSAQMSSPITPLPDVPVDGINIQGRPLPAGAPRIALFDG